MPILSVVVPCYNEERTLVACIDKVLAIKDEKLTLEIIIVDDCSSDNSLVLAKELERKYPEVRVVAHISNTGKGAALRTGFKNATGQFIAIQDADLEYDPIDLKRLIRPLVKDRADVVIGSRFLSYGEHRVLYFWHYLGNAFLTLLSNIFTDLNLTDIESCYKVFRKDIIDRIEIEENRFGFEPEIIAKIAHIGVRIYEIGISYHGRTYADGKKISARDGFRAIYCIFHYNASKALLPLQFIIYLAIEGIASLVNITLFFLLLHAGIAHILSAGCAFLFDAIVNYVLCILFLFRHKARWNSTLEILWYSMVVLVSVGIVASITKILAVTGAPAWLSTATATVVGLVVNFAGRRYLVFPERRERFTCN